jgi:hypothetical protein
MLGINLKVLACRGLPGTGDGVQPTRQDKGKLIQWTDLITPSDSPLRASTNRSELMEMLSLLRLIGHLIILCSSDIH